jgi:hypothetical protein
LPKFFADSNIKKKVKKSRKEKRLLTTWPVPEPTNKNRMKREKAWLGVDEIVF